MSRGLLHLDHGIDQGGAGLVAQLRGLGLRIGNGPGQGREPLTRSADTFVERREQGREPVLLLGDARRR